MGVDLLAQVLALGVDLLAEVVCLGALGAHLGAQTVQAVASMVEMGILSRGQRLALCRGSHEGDCGGGDSG